MEFDVFGFRRAPRNAPPGYPLREREPEPGEGWDKVLSVADVRRGWFIKWLCKQGRLNDGPADDV